MRCLVFRVFQLTYRVLASSTVSDQDPGIVIRQVRNSNSYTVCDLLPGVQYRFTVAAVTRTAQGQQAVQAHWTVIANPVKPDRPKVVERTTTTITIEIKPVLLLSGPVVGYFVVVYRPITADGQNDLLITRQKRQVIRGGRFPDPTRQIPLPGTTVAFLPKSSLFDRRWLKVGDNQTWGGYSNPPLEPDTRYDIFFVVMSSLDGVTKMSYAETESPAQTLPVGANGSGGGGGSSNLVWIILGSILGSLLLLFLLILLIICCILYWRKRSDQSDSEKLHAHHNNSWMEYYNNFQNTLTSDCKKWSDITEFSESRHVTTNETYVPHDLQVSDIQGGKQLISFEEEYKHLPVGMLPQYSIQIAQRLENQDKNRFDHLLAYDHSRVILKGRRAAGYINASYISGYQRRHAYIAAQSPFNQETIDDFWFMIFQERVTHIVLLVRLMEDGIVKCERYWPDKEHTIKCGEIFVQHSATDNFANFLVRIFDINKGRITRRVFQYHFTSWPDHGTPEDPIPFLEFQQKIYRSVTITNDTAPILVHCGTGVSRSAVFIALDSLMEQAKIENCVNVFKFVNKMRKNRTTMVRTLKQYIFLYDTLFEALITNYHIVGDDLKVNYRLLSNKNPATDRSLFREQFDVLERFVPELPSDKTQDALRDINMKKNRFPSIVPADAHRPVLHTPGGKGRTDYINALFIDGYLRAKNFIVTQTPLAHTVIDFWKLVWDYKISTIVMLNGSDFQEDSCAEYWPARKGQQKFDLLFVNMIHVSHREHVVVRSFKITCSLRPTEAPREVHQSSSLIFFYGSHFARYF